MRIVAISDTHGSHRSLQIPDGDVLVHAGDCTRYGRLREIEDLRKKWLMIPEEPTCSSLTDHRTAPRPAGQPAARRL
jgi:3',5'-cyclic AMP phosphodiesterase CpdA